MTSSHTHPAVSWFVAAGTAALAASQLAPRRRPALLLALAAAPLVYRGATGRWPGLVRPDGDTRHALAGPRGFHVRDAVRLERPPHEVYRFWRRLENLPRFMAHLARVRELGHGRSQWVARGPGGLTVEWEAEIVNDVADRLIGWRSCEGADLVTAGSVAFEPLRGGEATQVSVHLQYAPPGGRLGRLVASLFGAEPSQTIREDLRRFKQLLEAGEIARASADAPGLSGWSLVTGGRP